MSAFHDIWISSEVNGPAKHRLENTGWDKLAEGKSSVWESTSNKAEGILTRTHNEAYELLLLGQLYEEVSISQLLKDCTDYINDPSTGFNDPAGNYIIFLVNKRTGAVAVFTNRFGSYHAYWLNSKEQNIVSSYYIGLAKQAADKTLDWKGITGFLGMGFFPEDKTYLENVKIFEPASCYLFDAELKLSEKRRYWNWSHTPSAVSLKDNIEKLDEVMGQSLSYALKNKTVAIPISGGLDSRMLVGIITNEHSATALKGYSYGYVSYSVETQIAKNVAIKRKVPFEQFIVPNYLFDKAPVITDSVELFQYLDGTRQACMQDWLEHNSDLVVGGHWGDVWMDSMGIYNADGNDDDALLTAFRKKVLKKGSDWLLENIAEIHLQGSKKYLETYFTDFITKYKYIDDPDFRFKIFKTDQWSFRWTLSSIRMYQAAVLPVLPFYDKRVADLFITIPTDMLKGRHLQIEYLKKYHPDLARIKWQDYGSNLYRYKWLNNRNIVYRAVNKMKRIVLARKHIQRNWEVFYLNNDGRKNLENILLNNKALNKIISPNKVKSLLDDFYKTPNAANGYSISMLVTLAQFTKVVLQD